MIGSVCWNGAETMQIKELAMRSITSLALIATLAGCSYAPPRAPMVDQRAQARLAQLVEGKVAGVPQSCLPQYRMQDMIVIDDNTIAFRDGTNRVWITHPQGGCNLLGAGGYTLVTRRATGMGLCRGDIGEVVDLRSRSTVGSCAMGDFVPYERPAR